MLRRICSLILLFSFGVAAAVDTSVSVPMKATRVGTHSYYIQGLAGAASADNQG
ncbi:MAG: MBL fold metallo-hydrolase, partial [Hydrogenophilaceae bacterium]|nr:MBL fold metallo-hydrolase [Hydrogenophilaceae bacterium]